MKKVCSPLDDRWNWELRDRGRVSRSRLRVAVPPYNLKLSLRPEALRIQWQFNDYLHRGIRKEKRKSKAVISIIAVASGPVGIVAHGS